MPDQSIHRVGLLGWPVEHSLSPILHQAAFDAYDMPWCYDLLPINPAGFQSEIASFLSTDLRGFNVTAPYKEAIIPFLKRCDDSSQQLLAVNTVSKTKSGDWIGHNTDVIGLKMTLQSCCDFIPPLDKVTVLGNGGAARAVLHVLLNFPVRKIQILARDPGKTIKMLDRGLRKLAGGLAINSGLLSENQVEIALQTSQLIINATPVGMQHVSKKSYIKKDAKIPENLVFLDLIYHPLETQMMKQIIAGGGRACNGLEMLIHQAAAAFSIWTGKTAPIEIMKAALQKRNMQ
jgi:shikimate dehydrogenase